MKRLLTMTLFVSLIVGCRKKAEETGYGHLDKVRLSLKDSLSDIDFGALDFARSILTNVDSLGLYLVRIPFQGKNEREFVLVQTDHGGRVQNGRIVHLVGEITKKRDGGHHFNGTIMIQSLRRTELIHSSIEGGYIKAFHDQPLRRSALVQPNNVMPEVVITYVIPDRGGISLSSWIALQSLFGGNYTAGYYSYFANDEGQAGGGGGYPYSGGTGNNGTCPISQPPIQVDFEWQDKKDGIDIEKFVACFAAVPDAGSTCSIEIFTDIPVDANPNTFYDVNTGFPGHVFINVRKSNGTQHVTQNIGFYPRSGYKAMTFAPTASKLVNNEHHEFNASLKMNLTPAQLASVLVRMQQLANLNYDVDEYNCADWALDIFNHARTSKLQIPLYGIPSSPLTQHSRTPQGLYYKLQQMVNANDPEKANITIGIVKGYAGSSDGPCN